VFNNFDTNLTVRDGLISLGNLNSKWNGDKRRSTGLMSLEGLHVPLRTRISNISSRLSTMLFSFITHSTLPMPADQYDTLAVHLNSTVGKSSDWFQRYPVCFRPTVFFAVSVFF